jgi:hypothetical protein
MNHRFAIVSLFCIFAFLSTEAAAQPNRNQARNAVRKMAGFELTGSSVRVKTISQTSPTTAEVTAEIRTVFRLEQDKQGHWRVAEIRTGQDRWERVDLIAQALHVDVAANECSSPDPPFRASTAVDPSHKRARCLLGNLLGVEVPSDSLRIQEITPLAVPMSTGPSALVVAWVRIDAQLNQQNRNWQVTALRTPPHNWVQIESVVAAINSSKQKEASAELEVMAKALERFRAERGFYIVSDSQSVVIDHLSPRFLSRVIRIDPWNQPYRYQGERDQFTLRSIGPDTKEGTADDVVVSRR